MIHAMELHAERRGHGPRLVLVHGFTQSSRCWGPVADELATDHEVVQVDAPGHAGSTQVVSDLPGGARLIGDVGERATYLGYSMGGRYCLHLALDRPELVAGLVLLGATAGLTDPAERVARHQQDLGAATRLRRDGLEVFIDDWLAQPLFAGIPAERTFRAERLRNTVEGLATSLERAGTGAQEPLWDALPALQMPVLVVAGAHDEKFADLGARMVSAIGPNATLARIDGAGHAAHLERPERFLATLRPWLAEHEG